MIFRVLGNFGKKENKLSLKNHLRDILKSFSREYNPPESAQFFWSSDLGGYAIMDPLGLVLIFLARILDVSCGTLRILFLVRGRSFQASLMGFCEVTLYMLVLGYILGGGGTLTLPQLLAYAGGYAAGNWVGVLLEEKLMNSFVMLEIIAERSYLTQDIVQTLRDEGFGATLINGKGKNGIRHIIKVVCRRKDIPRISSLIGDRSCVFLSDVKGCWGGQFPLQKRFSFKG